MASNAKRPPGASYTVIKMGENNELKSGNRTTEGGYNIATLGMTFEMNHGLVQLTSVDASSPVVYSSLTVGDFILAINGVVTTSVESTILSLSEASGDMLPILYFNVRQIRVSMLNKVLDDSYKKKWSESCDECVLSATAGNSNPLSLRFNDSGTCVLNLHNNSSLTLSDHPLNEVVKTLNNGIGCVLDAIRPKVNLNKTPAETPNFKPECHQNEENEHHPTTSLDTSLPGHDQHSISVQKSEQKHNLAAAPKAQENDSVTPNSRQEEQTQADPKAALNA
eukprot:scaffold9485_cov69-Cyclotella_meneghiniana.AAC.6